MLPAEGDADWQVGGVVMVGVLPGSMAMVESVFVRSGERRSRRPSDDGVSADGKSRVSARRRRAAVILFGVARPVQPSPSACSAPSPGVR